MGSRGQPGRLGQKVLGVGHVRQNGSFWCPCPGGVFRWGHPRCVAVSRKIGVNLVTGIQSRGFVLFFFFSFPSLGGLACIPSFTNMGDSIWKI